ncbi:Muscleblind-like protein 2 [Halotydeus destructor]|nr:Muscleblind-like protein 2 [Halotydeus destructor]
MAMVNGLVSKDSRWLQLEVCREFQRGKCSRTEETCKYAHPGQSVEVQNGRVVACYDSIKGRCNREKPPCKYFHPPQHLKDQLLINGRNHLALKNALLQQMPLQTAVLTGQLPVITNPGSLLNSALRAPVGMLPTSATSTTCSSLPTLGSEHFLPDLKSVTSKQVKRVLYRAAISPYFTSLPAMAAAATAHHQAYGAYPGSGAAMPHLMSADQAATLTSFGMMPVSSATAALLPTAKSQPRTDRLEVCREFQRGSCKRQEQDCRYAHPPSHVQIDANDGLVTVCMDYIKGRCGRDQGCRYLHPPTHLQAQLKQQQMHLQHHHMQHQQQQQQLNQHQQSQLQSHANAVQIASANQRLVAAVAARSSHHHHHHHGQPTATGVPGATYATEPSGYFLCLHQK